MLLQDRLNEMKAKSLARLPEEILASMRRNLNQLKASGRREEALGVGAAIPAFSLADGNGLHHGSAGLLERGPLVINFFRGFW